VARRPDRVRIVGIPQDLGQSLRGVDMGPSALRYAGLARRLSRIGLSVEDAGNVEVEFRDLLDGESGMACLDAVAATAERVARAASSAVSEGSVPLFLGGDHSIALGTIAGVTAEAPVGVLWIDAHGDFNVPETSPTGNIHGMPLAALMGLGAPELVDLCRKGPKLEPPDAIIVGARSVDEGERRLLSEHGVGIYTMREIDERGISAVAREALKRLEHRDRIHVSFDVDSLDPLIAPGVGTPVPGGLEYREAHLLMEIVADDGRLSSLDVVEINPILDERNRTAEVAVELVASMLGQRIL